MKFNHPVMDLHTHLRNNIPHHTKIAKESGIDVVIYMANTNPPLDNLEVIQESLKEKRYCTAIPVSAITKGLNGKELVDVKRIKQHVVGFSDDGKYLNDLGLLQEILEEDVLILAHCCPDYDVAIKNSNLETKFIENYLSVLEKTNGKLHIQHVSKKESVEFIRYAKKQNLRLTCETCPHYFTYTKDSLDTKVNPPLGTEKDIEAIKEGLFDGTIDIITSDYAPNPRITGISSFQSFLPLSYGIVLDDTLTKEQLKEKLFINPMKIIKRGGYKLDLKS